MKTGTPVCCTICGEVRTHPDGWFLLTENQWTDRLKILSWNEALVGHQGVLAACSAAHVQQMVVHWMAVGSLEYPMAGTIGHNPLGPQAQRNGFGQGGRSGSQRLAGGGRACGTPGKLVPRATREPGLTGWDTGSAGQRAHGSPATRRCGAGRRGNRVVRSDRSLETDAARRRGSCQSALDFLQTCQSCRTTAAIWMAAACSQFDFCWFRCLRMFFTTARFPK
jgi:hypothetical protein